MKSYIKGLITGLLIGAVIFAVPAIAENIDALFNQVRINVNGVDQIQWGEEIELEDGSTTPASILYNGTTYLPMRKLGELSGQKIYWNGDSKTVAMTGAQKNVKNITEKEDADGNVWKYYTFEDADGNNYLGVSDEARGYERVYQLAGLGSSVLVTDNGIYFARIDKFNNSRVVKSTLMKLSFDSDKNSQDGTILALLYDMENSENGCFEGSYIYSVCIDGDYGL